MNTTITVNAGDDGINASEYVADRRRRNIDVQRVKRVLRPRLIHQVGGTITVKSSDDGLNAKDWTLESSDEQGPGQQTKKVKSEAAKCEKLRASRRCEDCHRWRNVNGRR